MPNASAPPPSTVRMSRLAIGSSFLPPSPPNVLRDGHRGRGERQLDRERRSSAFGARAGDGAAVRIDDRLRDREAETDAGDGVDLRFARAVEPLEEPFLLACRDTGAGVANLDARAAGSLERTN